MDTGTVQWWAEEIAKLAPIGTMLIALVAATIALRSFRSQRDIARKRAALDLMLKFGTEKTLIEYRSKADAALAAYNACASVEEFNNIEHYTVFANTFRMFRKSYQYLSIEEL